MILRQRPAVVMRAGMIGLVLASLWKWFARPTGTLSPHLLDGITGFLYGATIALLLLGLWMKSRQRPSSV